MGTYDKLLILPPPRPVKNLATMSLQSGFGPLEDLANAETGYRTK